MNFRPIYVENDHKDNITNRERTAELTLRLAKADVRSFLTYCPAKTPNISIFFTILFKFC